MVYLDNAATTAMSEVALSSLMEVSTNIYGNPSSVYRFGRQTKRLLEESRKNNALYLVKKKKSLLTVLELSRRKYISHHAEQKVITGL